MMSTAGSATSRVCPQSVGASLWAVVLARVAHYAVIVKPRISVMVLFTVSVGYVLGSAGNWQLIPLLHALLGIALVAAGSSALNQSLEVESDARMRRTADRPLPSGHLSSTEVLGFGLTAGIAGTVYLAVWVNGVTALLAVVALLVYVAVYTPLKKITSLCTAVGAISGALPPLMGWSSAAGRLDLDAFILFGVLFLWQFPHFLAIAWLYRQDYERAGLKMLPGGSQFADVTGYLAVAYVLVLLPVSLLPSRFSLAGTGYFWAAVVLGSGYLLCAVRFSAQKSDRAARGLVLSSLLYLPLLLLSLLWDHLQLLS
jgi:protoheme IX farnesyltransferase